MTAAWGISLIEVWQKAHFRNDRIFLAAVASLWQVLLCQIVGTCDEIFNTIPFFRLAECISFLLMGLKDLETE